MPTVQHGCRQWHWLLLRRGIFPVGTVDKRRRLSQNENTRLGFYWEAIRDRVVLLKLNDSENSTDCDTAVPPPGTDSAAYATASLRVLDDHMQEMFFSLQTIAAQRSVSAQLKQNTQGE